MNNDILYLEKSRLLSQKITNMIPEARWKTVTDEESFLEELFRDPPLIIVIGDTGPSDPVTLLFCLKSLPEYNRIPVIFYGEDEYLNILPVRMKMSRDHEQGNSREKKALISLLKETKEERKETPLKGEIPNDFKEPDFTVKRARSVLYENLLCTYIYNEISSINIVDTSLKDVLTGLCEKLEKLLLLDFSAILYTEESFERTEIPPSFGVLHLRSGLPANTLTRLKDHCLKQFSENKTQSATTNNEADSNANDKNVKIEWEVISRPAGKNPPININNLEFILTDIIRVTGFRKVQIFLGYYKSGNEKPVELPGQLTRKIPEYCSFIMSKASRYYSKINENQIIFKAFCQFLPAPIINDLLLKESEKALLTGQKRNIVVLFSHIHHFDGIVETNTPQRVVDFLNSHFTRMVKIIQKYGGTIDKFIGDAIFAIFGAPISFIDNAQRAADAAVEMINEFYATSLEDMHLPGTGISIGVGLNEGEAIIGNIGCADKFDYTAIGDTVNLAARLESLTKHYKQDILMSKVVADSLNETHYCRLIDRAKVKGKNEATEIYSLIVRSTPYTDEWRVLYHRGFKMYTLGSWYTAAEYFNKALMLFPSDPVCKILLERCLEYQKNNPEEWDGAIALDFK